MFSSSCLPLGAYAYNNDGVLTNESLEVLGGAGSWAWTIDAGRWVKTFTKNIAKPTTLTTWGTYCESIVYNCFPSVEAHSVQPNGSRIAIMQILNDPPQSGLSFWRKCHINYSGSV